MDYAEAIESKGILLYIAEAGLLTLFLVHIYTALKLTAENKEARPQQYFFRHTLGGSTLGSRTMVQTGLVIFVFLILHISTFKFGVQPGENLYANVLRRFSEPAYSLFYIFAVTLLGIHVGHGVQSAFQTLGFNHNKYTPLVRKISLGFALIIAVGFSSFPLYFMMRGGRL